MEEEQNIQNNMSEEDEMAEHQAQEENTKDTNMDKEETEFQPMSERKFLQEKFNYWYEIMLDRLIGYRQALKSFYNEPTKTVNIQSGETVSVYEIAQRRKQGVDEAIEYVYTLQDILQKIGESVPVPQNEVLEEWLDTTPPDKGNIQMNVGGNEQQAQPQQ